MDNAFTSVLDAPQIGSSRFKGLIDFQSPDLYAQKTPEDIPRLNERLMELERSYELVGDSSLIANMLARVPALYTLLKEAVQPLRRAFGDTKYFLLEALESDDDTVLRVMVRLSFHVPRPAELMHTFKRDWWLKNCSRSQASLVFDYETGDGF